jgi:hypothetical protein
MSTRISSFALPLLLAGCGNGAVQPQAGEGAERIDCAIGRGAQYGPDCLVEREQREGEALLVVRQPGGGYRRFVMPSGGGAIDAADGADAVTSRMHGGYLEVSVAQERYRFPASDAAHD